MQTATTNTEEADELLLGYLDEAGTFAMQGDEAEAVRTTALVEMALALKSIDNTLSKLLMRTYSPDFSR